MAIISGPGGVDLEAALAAVGVSFVHAPGDDVPEDLLDEVLGPDERQVRAVVVAQPPDSGEEDSGMGAWHVNAAHEVHYVRSGRGMVQFALPQGIWPVREDLYEQAFGMVLRRTGGLRCRLCLRGWA